MQILPEIQNEYGRLDTVVVGLASKWVVFRDWRNAMMHAVMSLSSWACSKRRVM